MKTSMFRFAVLSAALGFFAAAFAFSQSELNQGQGSAVVTVLPSNGAGATSPAISQDQLSLKVSGKSANISKWERLQGRNAPVQMVVLIDDGAGHNLGAQLPEIAQFIKSLPPTAEVAVAYMDHGGAAFAGPLSKDHAAVARALRLPSGQPGISGSPYFCLSDLAHHWPSQNPAARRIAVMITDGIDNYDVRYNPEDPYVQAAIHDAVRSRISVYSIYWRNLGGFDRGWYAANDGQNLLAQLTSATGGYSYWQGTGNPVSFQPYFQNLGRRLRNQYGLSFTAPMPQGPGVQTLSLHANGTSAKLVAPKRVFVGHPATGRQPSAQGE